MNTNANFSHHSATLNLRYDYPIWSYRIPLLYSKTQGWIRGTNYWFSTASSEKHISASLEPSGLIFSALMDEEAWNIWLSTMKKLATEIMGYQIGEIELGEVGHEPRWVNEEFSVFGKYSELPQSEDIDQAVEELLAEPKNQMTELDEIELEQLLFRDKRHHRHDELASGFQSRSHPATAKFLYDVIVGQKIPEFDYKPVSRKCVWALADIGTPEAKDYLRELSKGEDDVVKEFAERRLMKWEGEQDRKGRRLAASGLRHKDRIEIKPYEEIISALPTQGNIVSAYQSSDSIIVYQAYKPSIANYAVANQQFGGNDFSFNRMTWIKPNFLWMMYRSGWATKENQERILAMRISKSHWEGLLKEAVFSSYKSAYYPSEADWRKDLERSEVRLQWDPAHNPYGEKLTRKAIQIGIKGKLLKKFSEKMIEHIADITSFVNKQHLYVKHQQLQYLEIPNETVCVPQRTDLGIGERRDC